MDGENTNGALAEIGGGESTPPPGPKVIFREDYVALDGRRLVRGSTAPLPRGEAEALVGRRLAEFAPDLPPLPERAPVVPAVGEIRRSFGGGNAVPPPLAHEEVTHPIGRRF